MKKKKQRQQETKKPLNYEKYSRLRVKTMRLTRGTKKKRTRCINWPWSKIKIYSWLWMEIFFFCLFGGNRNGCIWFERPWDHVWLHQWYVHFEYLLKLQKQTIKKITAISLYHGKGSRRKKNLFWCVNFFHWGRPAHLKS